VIEGLLPEQVELAIRELARFHATWWNDARLESLRWLWPDVQSLSLLRELFSSALSKRQKELEAETPMLARVAAWLAESLAQSPAEPPPLKPPLTLVHSDFHVSNLFFPRPEGRFAVVDWQTVRVAETGATDLARLLVSGLGIERRRAHQDRLLGLYHEALSKNGVTDFSLAELRASYERSLLDQVLGQVIVTAAHDQPSALLELQGRRIEAALADSDFAKIEAPN
jgi:aminoglycoside phosphotransferase (APT) family kinase protein